MAKPNWMVCLLVGAAGCLEPEVPPTVRAVMHAAPTFELSQDQLTFTMALGNDGPGRAVIAGFCPWHRVESATGEALPPSMSCVAWGGMNQFLVELGEVVFLALRWRARDERGDRLPLGAYTLIPDVRGFTPDGEELALRRSSTIVQLTQ
jgi:hypothetical protein